jgi:hypothetical protein
MCSSRLLPGDFAAFVHVVLGERPERRELLVGFWTLPYYVLVPILQLIASVLQLPMNLRPP